MILSACIAILVLGIKFANSGPPPELKNIKSDKGKVSKRDFFKFKTKFSKAQKVKAMSIVSFGNAFLN